MSEHIDVTHDEFEDESDWIQVADESFDSLSVCCLDSVLVSREHCNNESFRITSNGSIVFDRLSQAVGRAGLHSTAKGGIDNESNSDATEELAKSMEDKYQIIGILGEGSYGVVFKAKDKETEELFAIKKVCVDSGKLKRCHFVNEMLALHELNEHSSSNDNNLVKLIDVYSYGTEQAVGMVLEYMDCGSLASLVSKTGSIKDEHILAYVCNECLSGLKYIHSKHMIHRDIKPENILIDSMSRIKLSDFGLAKHMGASLNRKASTFVGTLKYMAPERCVQSALD